MELHKNIKIRKNIYEKRKYVRFESAFINATTFTYF